ncbi:helix-turn-helix domain-containing protein [Actinomycetospora sp. OC33-EN08]|uniref:Helix-turn-helix domain-containing protein n=1 Tax=Actinomycetospora aurantiaca TaxID=3129233 RepID=A0ABU8MT32_9PSEU
MNQVRSEVHDLRGVPTGERSERWQTMLSTTHLEDLCVAIAPDEKSRPFQARIERRWIDDLALVDTECDPCSGKRRRDPLADSGPDHVAVVITRRGRESFAQGDHTQDMAPGDAVVWELGRPVRFVVWEPMAKRTLLIPRRTLDEVSGKRWAAGGIVLDGAAPATSLLTGYLDVLSHTLDQLTPAGVSAARNATLELLIGALRPGERASNSGAVSPALRATMNAWIERHLVSGDITPARIAAAHGVSVRSVYRLFEESDQTVSAYIRLRRLARARADLASGTDPVSAIAERWGFSDPSHFARAFRLEYGRSPRDFRASGSAQASA